MYDFISLENIEIAWSLEADGQGIKKGVLRDLAVKPQKDTLVKLGYSPADLKPGHEYFLNMVARTRQADGLIPEGYILATEQIALDSKVKTMPILSDNLSVLQVVEHEVIASVIAPNFRVDFDKERGVISKFTYYDNDIITKGPKPNFWRAPIDNDFGNGMDKRCAVWKQAGQNLEADNVDIRQIGKDEVKIIATHLLSDARGMLKTTYRIFGNADIAVENAFVPEPVAERKRAYIENVDPKLGNALNFSAEEPIMLKLPKLKDGPLHEFTLETSLKIDRFKQKSGIWVNHEWAPGTLHLEFRDNTLCFFVYGCDYQYFDYEFEEGKWYHIGLVYSVARKSLNLFIDGQLVEKKSFSDAVPVIADGESYIGGYHNGNRLLQGSMLQFRIWQRALKTDEIRNRYSKSLKGDEDGLLVYFEFDEINNLMIWDQVKDHHASLIETEQKMPELPRFGMAIDLPGKYKNLAWFGRGPHENYCDRKTSAYVDLYQGQVENQYFPYIRPQENGYKTDTRWLMLTDEEGVGVMITTDSLFSFSALNFSMDDLDQGDKKNYKHTNDLKPRDKVFLNIDYMQTGVGGDNSWGARPHPQYTLKYGEYRYSYIIRPLRRPIQKDEAANLSRQRYK